MNTDVASSGLEPSPGTTAVALARMSEDCVWRARDHLVVALERELSRVFADILRPTLARLELTRDFLELRVLSGQVAPPMGLSLEDDRLARACLATGSAAESVFKATGLVAATAARSQEANERRALKLYHKLLARGVIGAFQAAVDAIGGERALPFAADAVADAMVGARKAAEAVGQEELAQEISWQSVRLAEVGFDLTLE